MPVKKELLDILACPACQGAVSFDEANDKLICCECSRAYPIKDDIPIMLVEESVIAQK